MTLLIATLDDIVRFQIDNADLPWDVSTLLPLHNVDAVFQLTFDNDYTIETEVTPGTCEYSVSYHNQPAAFIKMYDFNNGTRIFITGDSALTTQLRETVTQWLWGLLHTSSPQPTQTTSAILPALESADIKLLTATRRERRPRNEHDDWARQELASGKNEEVTHQEWEQKNKDSRSQPTLDRAWRRIKADVQSGSN